MRVMHVFAGSTRVTPYWPAKCCAIRVGTSQIILSWRGTLIDLQKKGDVWICLCMDSMHLKDPLDLKVLLLLSLFSFFQSKLLCFVIAFYKDKGPLFKHSV